MNSCKNQYCHSTTADIYADGGWIRVCPICGAKEMLPAGYRNPTQADRKAGEAYSKVKHNESARYSEAERLFREAYEASTDDGLRAGYIWWAVICCYGVEYVEEILYKNDPQRRSFQYTPVFMRFPFNGSAISGCKTLSLFREYRREHPHADTQRLFSGIESLYAETQTVLRQRESHCDVFIAWHDRDGSRRCKEFAKALESELIRKKIDCFVSFRNLNSLSILHYEPHIYAAIATARVFVIVVDDYDALGKKFLGPEIRRMALRRRMDSSIAILFCGLSDHTGAIPDFMTGWQLHYQDCENTPDRIALVTRDVFDALTPRTNKVSFRVICAVILIMAVAGGYFFISARLRKSDNPTTVPAMTQPPAVLIEETPTPIPQEVSSTDAADTLRAEISEWKSRGIAPADVLARIRQADDEEIDLSGIDRDAIYEEAAMAAAGSAVQCLFIDWDGDRYSELLALNASGTLSLYGMKEDWKVISSVDSGLTDASCSIVNESVPLIVILSTDQDAFTVVGRMYGRLNALFSETGISRYKAEGSTVTFSRLLEGAAASCYEYTYEAASTTSRPVQTGIDWQPDDLPQPTDATSAVQRYFEARAYGISDAAALLVHSSSDDSGFASDRLAGLAVPDAPCDVSAAAYLVEDERALFEVTYTSNARKIRAWVCAEYIDGWKLTGAAQTYADGLPTANVDYAIPLLGLNAETTNTLSQKGERQTWRVLVPCSGRIGLRWQSGSAEGKRNAHNVSMVRDSLAGETVFSHALKPSLNYQQSSDQALVAAGVYYVTVTALIADAEPYHMTLQFTADPHVELEDNDIPARATPIEIDTAYSGVLSNERDQDYYAFTLDAASAVNVSIGLPGNGGSATSHILTVLRASDGTEQSSPIKAQGNARLVESGNLYLSSGTYWVKVAKGSSLSHAQYTLTVHAEPRDDIESEPNDTRETANAVPVNADIHASTEKEGDVDCYTFTLVGDAVVQPRFTFASTNNNTTTYKLAIANSRQQGIHSVNIKGKEVGKVITPVALPAGTYYVEVRNPEFVRQDYTLRLVSEPVEQAENEPNNSEPLATALVVDQPCTGILSSSTDVDYYKVSFAQQTTVTLCFAFAQSTQTDTAFELSAKPKEVKSFKIFAAISGDRGGIAIQVTFPEGETCIQVKPSAIWLGRVYTITLES